METESENKTYRCDNLVYLKNFRQFLPLFLALYMAVSAIFRREIVSSVSSGYIATPILLPIFKGVSFTTIGSKS